MPSPALASLLATMLLYQRCTASLQRPAQRAASRPRRTLAAVAKLASRPAAEAKPQAAPQLGSVKQDSQAYIEQFVLPVSKSRQQVVSEQLPVPVAAACLLSSLVLGARWSSRWSGLVPLVRSRAAAAAAAAIPPHRTH